jgi:hypothetical protein
MPVSKQYFVGNVSPGRKTGQPPSASHKDASKGCPVFMVEKELKMKTEELKTAPNEKIKR